MAEASGSWLSISSTGSSISGASTSVSSVAEASGSWPPISSRGSSISWATTSVSSVVEASDLFATLCCRLLLLDREGSNFLAIFHNLLQKPLSFRDEVSPSEFDSSFSFGSETDCCSGLSIFGACRVFISFTGTSIVCVISVSSGPYSCTCVNGVDSDLSSPFSELATSTSSESNSFCWISFLCECSCSISSRRFCFSSDFNFSSWIAIRRETSWSFSKCNLARRADSSFFRSSSKSLASSFSFLIRFLSASSAAIARLRSSRLRAFSITSGSVFLASCFTLALCWLNCFFNPWNTMDFCPFSTRILSSFTLSAGTPCSNFESSRRIADPLSSLCLKRIVLVFSKNRGGGSEINA